MHTKWKLFLNLTFIIFLWHFQYWTKSFPMSSFVQDYKHCRCYMNMGNVAVFVADLVEVQVWVSITWGSSLWSHQGHFNWAQGSGAALKHTLCFHTFIFTVATLQNSVCMREGEGRSEGVESKMACVVHAHVWMRGCVIIVVLHWVRDTQTADGKTSAPSREKQGKKKTEEKKLSAACNRTQVWQFYPYIPLFTPLLP